MVRRLLQHIVRWIRRFISQLQGTASRKKAPTKPQKPTAYQRLKSLPSVNSESPHSSQRPASTEEFPVTEIPQQTTEPQKELNPASPRATNPSNFQVFLSDYQRQPNAAIQDLNRQLLHGDTRGRTLQLAATDNTKKLPKADISKTESRIIDEPSNREEPPISAPSSSPDRVTSYEDTSIAFHALENKALTQESTVAKQQQQTLDFSHQSYIQLPETTVSTSHPSYQGIQSRIQPIETDITTPISNNLPQDIQSQIQPTQVHSLATNRESFTITETTADSNQKESSNSFHNNGRITKQGVVKLLFKLKKNNHHGYITPHDGSKDIIFHQKYVGDDIFSRLERGMAVEVTAHITAGKAYADCIRIL